MPADLAGLDALVHPGRRVDDDDARDRARGTRRAAARAAGRGHAVLGTCAGMIMLDREHLGADRHSLRAQRVRPPGAQLRGRSPARRASTTAASTRLHPCPVDRRARRGRRGPGAARRPSRRGPPGQHAGRLLPPRARATRSACTGCFSTRCARAPEAWRAERRDTGAMRIAAAATSERGSPRRSCRRCAAAATS